MPRLKPLALHLVYYIRKNIKDKEDERKYSARDAE